MIDFHTHIGQVWDALPPMTEDLMLRWMDEHEIEKVVLLPLESPESASFYCLTRDALAAGRNHPDRFIPFCVIDPRMSVSSGKASFRRIIEGYLEQGARGFGEVKVGLPMDSPLLQPLYETCDELGLCWLFHCDTERLTDEIGLPRLEKLLQTYPHVKFIGHAPGWWNHISADVSELGSYPKGPVVPGGRCDELLQKYPNMYGDLSAGSGANAIGRDPDFGREFLIRNREKLLFATDYLHPGQEVPQFELFPRLNLDPETRRLISHGNAERLLGK